MNCADSLQVCRFAARVPLPKFMPTTEIEVVLLVGNRGGLAVDLSADIEEAECVSDFSVGAPCDCVAADVRACHAHATECILPYLCTELRWQSEQVGGRVVDRSDHCC